MSAIPWKCVETITKSNNIGFSTIIHFANRSALAAAPRALIVTREIMRVYTH
jgi:hypothetical protein